MDTDSFHTFISMATDKKQSEKNLRNKSKEKKQLKAK